MLIKFSLENWMSYREKTSISMVATREQHHGERVTKVPRLKIRILPIALVFGGNASGKTNFFRALGFAKYMVTRGYFLAPDQRIPLEPYLLDSRSRKSPTSMSFTVMVGEEVYEYSFSLDSVRVVHERLARITSPAEGFGFERVLDDVSGTYTLTVGKAHAEERDLLELIGRSTRRNQLLLMTSVNQNAESFRPVYDWFDKTLRLISPTASYAPKEDYADESSPSFARMNELLALFDTGIRHIRRKPIDVSSIPLPSRLVKEVSDSLKEGETVRIEDHDRTFPYLLTRRDGQVVAEKLVACHAAHGESSEEEFELDHESDGTRRLIDLLPAFVDAERHDRSHVCIIDEIDRCLHTFAARKLVETFLGNCTNESRGQLLATTHDLGLMSQDLLRRDEMWLSERHDETSILYPVSDFAEARKDTDLRGSYLAGRMGGIPAINVL